MNPKVKRILRNLTVATLAFVPALTFANDVETSVFTEIANDIEKLETGVKTIGSAIIGVTIVGTSYIVGKRWIKKV